MPFPFSHICDLLQQLSDLPPARRSQIAVVRQRIYSWFDQHRSAIDELILNAASAAALLSALLPDLRTDRIYGVQAPRLQRIVVKALGLGHSRDIELSRWTHPSFDGVTVDLADCVESILRQTPNPSGPVVFIEDIDALLNDVAANCRFSSPAIRQAPASSSISAKIDRPPPARDQAIGRLYCRLSPRDAKWLTRLILKDYKPVVLDPVTVFRGMHPALPLTLRVHSDFVAAVKSLGQGVEAEAEAEADDDDDEKEASAHPSSKLCPRLGVKVGRQPWAKARSVKHCLAMGKRRRMSCERKLDGEYVQVHVNLSKGTRNCLQLFSKSGKDSTRDRIKLHSSIRMSLRIGEADCPLSTGCILEGEMLVYSDKEGKMLDFDAIRNHVTRSGWRAYCNNKRDYRNDEHLMIVYYDLLFLDGKSLLQTCHAERFRRLQELITCRPGRAELVQREVIDFGSQTAAAELRQAFARCITARQEGLVVKADDDTYFDFSPPGSVPLEWPYMRCYAIKLKKGYVGEFGEVGDFAMIGGRYDAAKAKEYPPDLPGLRWTHFFLGCLEKGSLDRKGVPRKERTRPRFVVTNVVTLTIPQMTTFLNYCRPRIVPRSQKDSTENGGLSFDLAPLEPGLNDSQGGPTDLFAEPPVVDIRCFAFHRQGLSRFWSPRFPCVTKFHFDRTYLDCITFENLQIVARDESQKQLEAEAKTGDPEDGGDDAISFDSFTGELDEGGEETAHWMTQLERTDPGGIAVDAETSESSAAVVDTTTTESGTSQLTDHSSQNPTDQLPGRPLQQISINLVSGENSQNSATTESSTLTAAFVKNSGDAEDEAELTSLPSSPSASSTPRPSSSPPPVSSPPALPLRVANEENSNGSPNNRGNCGRRNSLGSSSSITTVYNRKRHLTVWDVPVTFPAVSPPQLKRLKSVHAPENPETWKKQGD